MVIKEKKTCEYDYYYNDTTNHGLVDTNIIRYKVIENLRKAINLKNNVQNNVDDILKIMDELTKKYNNELLTNINDTINEQVNLILSCKP